MIWKTIWKTIWYVRNANEIVLKDNAKWKNIGTSCINVCSCIRGYPYSFTMVWTRTLLGSRMIIMFYIMLPWRLLLLTGVWYKELPEHARSTRKGTQQCANRLMGPPSHVWVVCRVYSTHPNCPLEEYHRKIDYYDRSHHCIHKFLHLTPIVKSLIEYFFKYSSHVLLLFQVKVRHSCTVDDDITTRDHDTCIG